MGWEQTAYEVEEDDGAIVACATVEGGCNIPFSFYIIVRTVDRTGMLWDQYRIVNT